MSDLHEVQNTVHVSIKPNKQRNQLHQEKVWDGWVKGQGPSIIYTTNNKQKTGWLVRVTDLAGCISMTMACTDRCWRAVALCARWSLCKNSLKRACMQFPFLAGAGVVGKQWSSVSAETFWPLPSLHTDRSHGTLIGHFVCSPHCRGECNNVEKHSWALWSLLIFVTAECSLDCED